MAVTIEQCVEGSAPPPKLYQEYEASEDRLTIVKLVYPSYRVILEFDHASSADWDVEEKDEEGNLTKRKPTWPERTKRACEVVAKPLNGHEVNWDEVGQPVLNQIFDDFTNMSLPTALRRQRS